MPTNQTTCPNCDTPRTGPYCAACGQDNRHDRLRLPNALGDAANVLLGVESKVWRTVIGLTTGPGKVARAYIEGRRNSYVHPMRYAFLTCAMWWAALALMFAYYYPPAVSENLTAIVRYGNWLNLIMMPVLAIPVWLLFLGSRRSWLDNFYALLFACGQVFLWRSALAVLAPLCTTGLTCDELIAIADSVGAILFMLWTLHGVHRGRVRWLWLRILAVAATFIFGTEYLIVAAVAILG